MRSWPRALLLVVPLLALGASAPSGEALRLRVLVAVYPDTFTGVASRDEVENVWREVTKAAEFVRRSSGGRLQLEVERVVVDRFVPRDDFEEPTPGHYWLNDQLGERKIVEPDLLARGHEPGRYDVVAVFYAWQNGGAGLSQYGAASIGTDRILGRAGYLAVPMAWGPDTLHEYFEHELLHCVEFMFEAAGAEFPHLHNGWAFEATTGGGQREWYAWVLANAPYQDYFDHPGRWGTIVRADEGFGPSS
jgi:hypothetical protein